MPLNKMVATHIGRKDARRAWHDSGIKDQKEFCRFKKITSKVFSRILNGYAVEVDTFIRVFDRLGIPSESPLAIEVTHPTVSTYQQSTWVERDKDSDSLLSRLQEQTQVVWISGISGIGKTAYGEKIAVQAWNDEKVKGFQWHSWELPIGQEPSFIGVAEDLLTRQLGQPSLTAPERRDPDKATNRLLNVLQESPYWLQVDSVERLLSSKTATAFIDPYWDTFLQRCLNEGLRDSRLILTAQALPDSLEEFSDRYENIWHQIRLDGLQTSTLRRAFFAKRALVVEGNSGEILNRIATIYEGHLLLMKVIADDILRADTFDGDVDAYWNRYRGEFEQDARELASRDNPLVDYNALLEQRVRCRIRRSLESLPETTTQLLRRISVYRRPVPKNMWLSLLQDCSTRQKKNAYQMLESRTLVENAYPYIRLHNLIRAIAYEWLREDIDAWRETEQQAAALWLSIYEAVSKANLEQVTGEMEAIYHYCSANDWGEANSIYIEKTERTEHPLHWQLFVWGYYEKLLQTSLRLAEIIPDDQQDLVRCQLNIGNVLQSLGHPREAMKWLLEAVRIAEKTGEQLGKASAYGNLGLVCRDLGDYDNATAFYKEQWRIARDINDLSGMANSCGNIGNILRVTGQDEAAIPFALESLSLHRRIGYDRGEAIALLNLADIQKSLNNCEQALTFCEQAINIFDKIGDVVFKRRARLLSGNLHRNLRNYGAAVSLYISALVGIDKLVHTNLAADIHVQLGVAHLLIEKIDEARISLEEALELYNAVNNETAMIPVLKHLTVIYKAEGNIVLARNAILTAVLLAKKLNRPDLVAEYGPIENIVSDR